MLAEDVRKAKYILFFIDPLTHKTTELAGSVDRWHFAHNRFKRTPTSMSEFNFPMMISRMRHYIVRWANTWWMLKRKWRERSGSIEPQFLCQAAPYSSETRALPVMLV